MHEPHTGAAALALRAELYRTHLLSRSIPHRNNYRGCWIPSVTIDPVKFSRGRRPSSPVNLTYYPIRAAENIALNIASRLVKDISEQMVEEIMTEGTMLLSGVDLDIRFGKPMLMTDYLDGIGCRRNGAGRHYRLFCSTGLKAEMRNTAYRVMQQYMQRYLCHDDDQPRTPFRLLFTDVSFNRIEEQDFRRRIFYAASLFVM